jgi:hypothetical protein
MRRAQDAIEEIHHFGPLSYEWVRACDIDLRCRSDRRTGVPVGPDKTLVTDEDQASVGAQSAPTSLLHPRAPAPTRRRRCGTP